MARTGRPSKIHEPVGHREDGTPITVADRIVQAIRAGNYLEPAAASAGVAKVTVYDWLKVAANAARRIAAGANRSDLSQHERRCLDFANAVREAEGAWEVDANARLQQLAIGGTTTRVETVKVDADGNVVERTTKVETLAPSAQVLEWRLTRRFPTRYSQRVEVTGAEGEPLSIELRARNLADALRDFQAGAVAAQQVAETETPA